ALPISLWSHREDVADPAQTDAVPSERTTPHRCVEQSSRSLSRADHNRIGDLVVPPLTTPRAVESRRHVADHGADPADEGNQRAQSRDEVADQAGSDSGHVAVARLDD